MKYFGGLWSPFLYHVKCSLFCFFLRTTHLGISKEQSRGFQAGTTPTSKLSGPEWSAAAGSCRVRLSQGELAVHPGFTASPSLRVQGEGLPLPSSGVVFLSREPVGQISNHPQPSAIWSGPDGQTDTRKLCCMCKSSDVPRSAFRFHSQLRAQRPNTRRGCVPTWRVWVWRS